MAQPGEKSIIAVVKKGAFTVVAAAGMRQRKKRWLRCFSKELHKAKPDKWGCVQACQLY